VLETISIVGSSLQEALWKWNDFDKKCRHRSRWNNYVNRIK